MRRLDHGDLMEALTDSATVIAATTSLPRASHEQLKFHTFMIFHRETIFALRHGMLSAFAEEAGLVLYVPWRLFPLLNPGPRGMFMGINVEIADVPNLIFGVVPEELR